MPRARRRRDARTSRSLARSGQGRCRRASARSSSTDALRGEGGAALSPRRTRQTRSSPTGSPLLYVSSAHQRGQRRGRSERIRPAHDGATGCRPLAVRQDSPHDAARGWRAPTTSGRSGTALSFAAARSIAVTPRGWATRSRSDVRTVIDAGPDEYAPTRARLRTGSRGSDPARPEARPRVLEPLGLRPRVWNAPMYYRTTSAGERGVVATRSQAAARGRRLSCGARHRRCRRIAMLVLAVLGASAEEDHAASFALSWPQRRRH